MKTLHKIFHKGLFLNSLKGGVFSLVAIFFTYAYGKMMGKESAFYNLTLFIYFIAIFLAPLYPLIINNSFVKNVKWLINQNYNRKELIVFYFFSQSLKFALSLLHYLIVFVALASIDKSVIKSVTSLKFDFSTYEQLWGYLAFVVAALWVIYLISMFNANYKEVMQLQARKSVKKRSFKQDLPLYFILSSLVITIQVIKLQIPVVLIFLGFIFAMGLGSFNIFNRTFNLLEKKHRLKFSMASGGLLLLPFLVITFLMTTEVHDKRLTYSKRIPSVLFLQNIVSDYSKEEVQGFVSAAKTKGDVRALIKNFGSILSTSEYLKLIDTKDKAFGFINAFSRKVEMNEVDMIVEHMNKLKYNLKLDHEFDRYSYSFFIKQEVSIEYISSLMGSDSSYKQLAAFYFAKKSLKKEEFTAFLKQNKEIFVEDLQRNKRVKRSLANIEEK